MKAKAALKIIVKGAAAGAASTFAMSKFQTGLRHKENLARKDGRIPIQKQEARHMGKDASATVKLANRATKKVLRREVPKQRQKLASDFFHYGFGALVWIVGDNAITPLLKLSEGPLKENGGAQARALGAHLVYGVCLKYLYKGLSWRQEDYEIARSRR